MFVGILNTSEVFIVSGFCIVFVDKYVKDSVNMQQIIVVCVQ